mmetsp:Transcript_3497/g.3448  ORF Transcript_3497/g.3448 Transcript_3497/m.3448 type:complete len:138 (+) Transcript_3497:519-932(+)|eukprot:CAMPEP_0170543418 /NCGR_PEP_ID=MMETSP0211-20121228/2537_1 /TAXON_ID=311385 /ORGANISM="Pseudokeronopsis sp., Strain OXSARD2" /LENGTH=137 /DNA_ID=CAMNT_0010846783 /DNA_START=810 /DNA_END=1223 /DNA_ORIENTATION=+
MTVYDTAGSEQFKSVCRSYYRGRDGVVLAYDITSQASFNNIQLWLNELEEVAPTNCSKILVGNKLDLIEEKEDNDTLDLKQIQDRIKSGKVVKTEEAMAFAKKNNLLFQEVSSKSGKNLKKAFEYLALDILRTKRMH